VRGDKGDDDNDDFFYSSMGSARRGGVHVRNGIVLGMHLFTLRLVMTKQHNPITPGIDDRLKM
jgi:hypothetical protein